MSKKEENAGVPIKDFILGTGQKKGIKSASDFADIIGKSKPAISQVLNSGSMNLKYLKKFMSAMDEDIVLVLKDGSTTKIKV